MVPDFFNKESQLSALVNRYCREFACWSLYAGVPKHDPELAKWMLETGSDLHLKIDFTASDSIVFVPIAYFSTVGEHRFRFPAFEYSAQKEEFRPLGFERFLELIKITLPRLEQSIEEQAVLDLSIPTHSLWALPAKRTIKVNDKLASFKRFQNDVETESGMPLTVYCINQFMIKTGLDGVSATRQWFERYLEVLTDYPPYDAIALDAFFLPQSTRLSTSDGAMDSWSVEAWIEEVLVGHLFVLMAQIGQSALCTEQLLIDQTYAFFAELAAHKNDPIATAIVTSRHFKVRGKLTKETDTYHRLIPNVLHEAFREDVILNPQWGGPVYFKSYLKEGVSVCIRPFDIDRDLEMVHEWFHREHAKAIWQMNWPIAKLETFYRTLLPNRWTHAYIGEINGKPTFNFEVYWATRDIVGDYFDVLPSDYGTHLFIAPTDKREKFPSLTMQSILDWLFAQDKVGRLVGEGAVESMAALMNKIHVGFRLQGIIDMPHKRAHLNFCYREWYWEKFPENRPLDEQAHEPTIYVTR